MDPPLLPSAFLKRINKGEQSSLNISVKNFLEIAFYLQNYSCIFIEAHGKP